MKIKLPIWLYSFFLVVMVTALLPLLKPSMNHFNSKVFALSLLVSFLLWGWLGMFYSLFSYWKALRSIIALLISVLTVLLLTATIFLYLEFRSFITVDMLKFVLDDPEYLLNYVKTYLLNIQGLYFIFGVAVCFAVWFRAKSSKISWKKVLFLVIIIPVWIPLVRNLRKYDTGLFLTLDASLISAVDKYARLDPQPCLYASFHRLSVKPINQSPGYNIVLVLNESLSMYGMYGRATPFLNDWMSRDSFLVYSKFFTNSSSTDISVPSLFTGVAPYESMNKFHTMPLVWDWMRAAGYRTIFVTAQRANWANFDEFFLKLGPDFHSHALIMDTPIIHDLGVDDLAALDYFAAFLTAVPSEEKFFAVYNSNALHVPYQQTSRFLEIQPDFDVKYENALFILDKGFEKIFATLSGLGVLDDTIVIITGDHGSYSLRDNRHRLYDYYRDFMNIPFLIRLPESWIRENPEMYDFLRENQSSMASNLDLVPTLVDMVGLSGNNQDLLAKLEGNSLAAADFRRKNEHIVVMNTNEFRLSEIEGFGIYFQDGRSVVLSPEKGVGYYAADDLQQENNLASRISEGEQAEILRIIENTPQLQRIYQRYLR